MGGTSLINLGDLSKPATVLIEKISEAVGGIFKPYQIVRVAKAEAEAADIQAQSQIHVTELQKRAMHRFLEEESKKQENIESITAQALPLLNENSTPEKMEQDWITNFFDKSRIISDEQMQQLWSKLLVEEANAPGTVSRRTVNLIGDLDKRDAELFSKLCSFNCNVGILNPMVFDIQNEIYKRHGITFETIAHLDSLSLIKFESLTNFERTGINKMTLAKYFDRTAVITFTNNTQNRLVMGKVMFTHAGAELARICAAKPVDGFFEYAQEQLSTPGTSVAEHFAPVIIK